MDRRVPLKQRSHTATTRDTREDIRKRVATLRSLSKTAVLVPEVFYASFEDKGIGSPVVLMQKLAGRALQWYNASAQQKTKVMEQHADIFIELQRHPFSSSGSLTSDGEQVGPFAQVQMFSTPAQSLGPFSTLESALESIEVQQLEMIINGELQTLAVDNYLTHVWRLEHVPRVAADVADQSFYIKHADDKGDHILVDEEFNITGIIDWEFASTESKSLAFSSPCMIWPVGEFYNGSNELSAEEFGFAEIFSRRGRDDLAQCVLRGRKHQRLLYYLGAGVIQPEDFRNLFEGLRAAFGEGCKDSYQVWKSTAIAAYAGNDEYLQRLLGTEEGNDGLEQEYCVTHANVHL